MDERNKWHFLTSRVSPFTHYALSEPSVSHQHRHSQTKGIHQDVQHSLDPDLLLHKVHPCTALSGSRVFHLGEQSAQSKYHISTSFSGKVLDVIQIWCQGSAILHYVSRYSL